MNDRDTDRSRLSQQWRFRLPVVVFLLLFAWAAIARLRAGDGSVGVFLFGVALFAAMAGGFIWLHWREERDKR